MKVTKEWKIIGEVTGVMLMLDTSLSGETANVVEELVAIPLPVPGVVVLPVDQFPVLKDLPFHLHRKKLIQVWRSPKVCCT